MRRIKIILATIILAVVLLVVQIIIIRSAANYEPELEIIYSAKKIPQGTIITEDLLLVRKVSLGMVHKHSVKNMDSIKGKVAKTDIEKNEMLLKPRFIDSSRQGEITAVGEDSRLMAVDFKADQANGWRLKKDQYVDIIFVPDKISINNNPGNNTEKDNGIIRIESIRIAALIDSGGNIVDEAGKGQIPSYICFEVDKGIDEFLAFAKKNGRIEIAVIP